MVLPPYTADAADDTKPLDSVSGGYAAREIRAVKTRLTTTKSTADTALANAATAQGTANTALANANSALTEAGNNSDCLGVGNDPDLGTFTGVTIPDDSTVKEALQALESALEIVGGVGMTNAYSQLGTLVTDTDMGTFTGTLLPDDQSVKSLLQTLETRVETNMRIYNMALNGTTGTPSGGPDGKTFDNLNDLLAACDDYSTINIEVTGFLGTWNAIGSPVTRRSCNIHININYSFDAQKQGIKLTALSGAYICTLVDCEINIEGEDPTYSVIRLIAGASGLNIFAINANNSTVFLRNLTVEFANSAAHAAGSSFVLFNQSIGSARLDTVTAVWDGAVGPVPAADGLQIVKAGSSGESWADHDIDVSNMVVNAPTTSYYTGITNRKYMSAAFTSLTAPHTLAANTKNVFSLSTTGRVMRRITSGMLILTCTAADQNYAIGDTLFFAIGAPGSSVASDMGAFLVGNYAGTSQIVEIWLYIGSGGLSYVRNTPAYLVVALDLTKWSAVLYCRDES